MGALEAQRWGLVNQVVPADGLLSCARQLAQSIVVAAPLALSAVKEVLLHTEGQSLQQAYQTLRGASLPAYRAMLASEDAKEGPRAFGEKRPAVWRGC
jgi:crotonobetainyl-CoA hydratase